MSELSIPAPDLVQHVGGLFMDVFDGGGWTRIHYVKVNDTHATINGGYSVRLDQHVRVIPSQPDQIDDDDRELPTAENAADRVLAYIEANGDGLYDHTDGIPLYGRDLEAICREITTTRPTQKGKTQ